MSDFAKEVDKIKRNGIPTSYHGLYEEFLRDPEPLKLFNELARLRILAIMAGDFLEKELKKLKGSPNRTTKNLLKLIATTRNTVESISRVAERAKKIEEGLVITVNMDVQVLYRFLKEVVLLEVPERDRRARIYTRMQEFTESLERGSKEGISDMQRKLIEDEAEFMPIEVGGRLLSIAPPPLKLRQGESYEEEDGSSL